MKILLQNTAKQIEKIEQLEAVSAKIQDMPWATTDITFNNTKLPEMIELDTKKFLGLIDAQIEAEHKLLHRLQEQIKGENGKQCMV